MSAALPSSEPILFVLNKTPQNTELNWLSLLLMNERYCLMR